MDTESIDGFDNEAQFWAKLDETVSTACDTHGDIDDALRSYLTLTSAHPDLVQSDAHYLRRCAFTLYSSSLFARHPDYIRRQFVHCLLQEDEAGILHFATTFLLADARENEATFELLNGEGAFARLVDLVAAPRHDEAEEAWHRLLMELMYEMARLQRITNDDLTVVDDDFVIFLFDIIEQVSDDVTDPYHYPVIRVLLVLNEQFMVAAHDPLAPGQTSTPLTNKVMKVLSMHGSRYKTFGENIILLLNREDETSLQLLTLKLLYLLFTTPPTYEYFYTNDLHVLVDILIRNLLDLPEESSALRHTYLRVLFPLLEHTQLKDPPHYKRDEIWKLMAVLVGGHREDGTALGHFEEVDETTKRLVARCQSVSWLQPAGMPPDTASPTSDTSPITGGPAKSRPPALPAPRKLRKRTNSKHEPGTFLAPHFESARQSSLSVAEMASQREKPGVLTPSRNPSVKHGLREVVAQKNAKGKPPPPPKTRRAGWLRMKEKARHDHATNEEGVKEKTGPGTLHIDSLVTGNQPVQMELPSPTPDSRPRKPPPPQTRRWGRRRTHDDVPPGRPSQDQTTEAAATERRAAPVVMPENAGNDTNPFSPQQEKTLSPFADDQNDGAPGTDRRSKRMSSVGAALVQAQAQAMKDLEQTLERAQIQEETPEQMAALATENGREVREVEGHTSARSVPSTVKAVKVLAPPGEAPARGVPGPVVELTRSPFLGDNNGDDDGNAVTNAREPESTSHDPPRVLPPRIMDSRRRDDKSESEWDEWD